MTMLALLTQALGWTMLQSQDFQVQVIFQGLLMIGQPSIPGTGMNRIIGAGHSEYEWTIWSECKEGTQQRERLKQGGKSGKDFETKLCSKGFPTPKPPYRGFGVSGVPN